MERFSEVSYLRPSCAPFLEIADGRGNRGDFVDTPEAQKSLESWVSKVVKKRDRSGGLHGPC